jgi:hypothetical protein
MQEFLKKNGEFWRKADVRGERGRGVAFVDMLVAHPGYLMSGAILGKYLQRLKGYELTALVPPGQGGVICKQVAVSYGITQFVQEDDPIDPVRLEEVNRWIQSGCLDTSSVMALRKSVLDLEYDGVPIGDLIYDIYLMKTGLPSLLDVKHFLDHGLKPALPRLARALTVLDGVHVEAAVFGHIVYDRFGFLSRLIIRNGGRIYARKPASPPYALRSFDRLEDLPSAERYLTPDDIALIEARLGDQAVRAAQADMRDRLAGSQSVLKSNTSAYTNDRRVYTRQELAEATQTDPAKPNVFIMSQCLSDAPHTAKILFRDFADWLVQTAEHAKKIPEVNWIFKEHPDQGLYSKDWTCKRLIQRYVDAFPNIAYCPPDLTQRNMTEIVDAGISLHDAGLEFACKGIPVLEPGYGMTSTAGITKRPDTIEEYLSRMGTLAFAPRLTPEQIRLAELTWYAFKVAPTPCAFIPPHPLAPHTLQQLDEVFRSAEKLLDTARVEDDDLFRSFAHMVTEGSTYLHNIAMMETLQKASS